MTPAHKKKAVRARLAAILKTLSKSATRSTRILTELGNLYESDPEERLSTKDLARQCMPDLIGKGDEARVVRGVKHQINQTNKLLKKADKTRNSSDPILRISNAPFRLEPSWDGQPSESVELPASSSGLSADWFWNPFLDRSDFTKYFITEPSFFRTNDMVYVRDIYYDEFSDAKPDLTKLRAKYLGKGSRAVFKHVRHYVSTGEVMGFVHLLKMYFMNHCGLILDTMRTHSNPNNFPSKPFILAGSTRTNYLIKETQERLALPMQVRPRDVSIPKAKAVGLWEDDGLENWLNARRSDSRKSRSSSTDTAPRILEDTVALDLFERGPHDRFVTYAVVTRLTDYEGHPLLIAAANHGRAVEGAFEWLTVPGKMDKLLGRVSASVDRRTLSYLQILFAVEVRRPGRDKISDEAEVISTKALAVAHGSTESATG